MLRPGNICMFFNKWFIAIEGGYVHSLVVIFVTLLCVNFSDPDSSHPPNLTHVL